VHAIAFLVAIATTLATWWLAPEGADARNAVNVIAGAAATVLGFLVSAGALLYAVANTTLARNLQRTGHFGSLLSDLFLAAAAFLIALVVALACLFLPAARPGEGVSSPLTLGVCVMVFFNALAYGFVVPVGRKMWLLLSSLVPEGPLE
jgi:hypothetical protein